MRPLSPVVAGLFLLLAACTPTATPPTSASSPSASAAPAPSASASPSAPVTVPSAPATDGAPAQVYFVVDTDRGPRLARETRLVDRRAPARGALEAMIAGPQDPDYVTEWPAGTRILGISHHPGLITVDLSGEARAANVGAAYEGAMVAQLIWTVTGVLDPGASVSVHIEGQPAGDAWGHILWDKPVQRGDPLDIRLLVAIDSLVEGATVTSPVTISGEANVFEAHLDWQVRTLVGDVVQKGYTNTAEGQRFAPWSLTLDLPPGAYVFEAIDNDLSGGAEGYTPDQDTRSFTVR